jgi:hypothetical protein
VNIMDKWKLWAALLLSFCLFPAGVFGQAVWDVVYDGDYIPQLTAAPDEDLYVSQTNDFEPGTLFSGDGSESPESSPGFLRMVDDRTDQKSHRYEVKAEIGFDYAGTNGCTFVMRCRRRPGAAGVGNWDAWKFKQDGASQIFLGIGDWDGSTYHNAISIAPSGGTVVFVGEDSPGVDDWHVWRIAYYNDGGTTHITVYVDGDPTPVHSSTLDGDTTTGGLIQTVAQTSQTGEYDIDWVLITDDGDFGPDDALGPALPPGHTEEAPEPPPPATGVEHWELMGR